MLTPLEAVQGLSTQIIACLVPAKGVLLKVLMIVFETSHPLGSQTLTLLTTVRRTVPTDGVLPQYAPLLAVTYAMSSLGFKQLLGI